ncbi:hypothetical protein Zmor_006684 [Zophobas morio]|uniref:Pre-rRNA-processing protein RIX1 N-terminal domain-containing protein n=1 Tax=Zophobas morio TaxID=2755281 RepID=A0AA38MLM4_9CUCU|nr:hypothetical protein Zmor_006684 [Zophobas morio]
MTGHMEKSKYEASELVKVINNSLANSKTCNFGLELLQNLLPHCSNEILMENILHWTSYCIVQHKEDTLRELRLNTLARIIENSDHLEGFNKKFVTEYLSATLRICLVHRSDEEDVAALNCLMQCMKKYPSWFGNHKQKVESFLIECLDSSYEFLAETAAATFVCFLETGPAGQNGTNYVANFNKSFKRICATIHKLFNNFLNESSGQYYFAKIDEDVLEFKKLGGDIPSPSNLDVVTKRIINCLIFIKFLIVKKFSVEKRIEPKYLIDIVCRGLSIHICSSASAMLKSIGDHSVYLKKVQFHLLSIFRVYIKRFYTSLIPFSVVIENIFLNLLQRDHNKCDCFIVDMSFRASVYKSLSSWLSASTIINNELQYQEKLISIIFKDIMSPRRTMLLSVTDSNNKNADDRSLILINREIMYVQALDTLNSLVLSSFLFDQNLLKEVLLFILGRLNNSQRDKVDPVCNSTLCQVKLHEVLISLIKIEHSVALPSLHFIVNLLQRGLMNQNWKISQMSRQGLDILEKISQPLCPSLHVSTTQSAFQDAHRNNLLLDEHEETSQKSKNKCDKEINIISNILINTPNETLSEEPEHSFVSTEIEQDTAMESQEEDTPVVSVSVSHEKEVRQDVNQEDSTASVAELDNMFCSFQDVVQE